MFIEAYQWWQKLEEKEHTLSGAGTLGTILGPASSSGCISILWLSVDAYNC